MNQPVPAIIADTPEKINLFGILALKGSLKLEVLGMRRSRGPSAYSIVKQKFGFKGTKESVLQQLEKHISENLGNPKSQ